MMGTTERFGATVTPEDLPGYYSDPPDGIRVNMIMSLDGAAAVGGVAGPLSNACDQNLLRALRGYADVILVGAGTARAEGYGPVQLTFAQRDWRESSGAATPTPPIAVVTRTGALPASLFADPAQRPLLVTTAEVMRHRSDLAERADFLIAGDTAVDLAAAVQRLRARGLNRILCEGGPMLLDELIAAALVDEMCLTVSPTLTAAPPVSRPGAPSMREPARLSLEHALTVDDYLYLRYRARP